GKPEIDPLMRGSALLERARLELEEVAEEPDGEGAEPARLRALDSAEEAVRSLAGAGLLRAEASAIVAQLTSGARSQAAFRDCVTSARGARSTGQESYCWSAWARRLASTDPAAARTLAERASRLAEDAEVAFRVFAQRSVLQVRWAL